VVRIAIRLIVPVSSLVRRIALTSRRGGAVY
jgi:hypothetical protein